MSDRYLCLFPSDPQYVPEAGAQQAGLALFQSFLPETDAENFKMDVFDTVQVVHPIQNLYQISCPVCRAQVDEDWWYKTLNDLYDVRAGFARLLIRMPCCGATCSLNDLKYQEPVGFARYYVEVLYPDRDLTEDELEQLEQALGCHLRKTWKRY